MYRVDRQLPERSKLIFYFPNPDQSEGKFTSIELPFFENINLTENKAARYVTYKLLSRHSDLYGYTGADSRKFRLEFSISIPHLIAEYPNYINLDIIKRNVKKKLITTPENHFGPTQNNKSSPMQVQKFAEDYREYVKGTDTGSLQNVLENLVSQNTYNSKDAVELINTEFDRPVDDITKKAVEIVLYWVNIVRSSVVTNAKNPILGPPVVRLTHGVLYQDIPCIVKSYGISQDPAMLTFDLDTLMPNNIDFTLELEEFRAGDFGVFEKNQPIKRDNLAGYEAVIFDDNHSMDSGALK
jgi:hypothetical protein